MRALKSNLRDIDLKQTLPFAGQFSPIRLSTRLKFDQRTGYSWFLSRNIMLHDRGEKKKRERESFMIFDLLLMVNDLLGNISTDVIYKYMNV